MTDYFFLLYKFNKGSNNNILVTGKKVTEMFTDIFCLERHGV